MRGDALEVARAAAGRARRSARRRSSPSAPGSAAARRRGRSGSRRRPSAPMPKQTASAPSRIAGATRRAGTPAKAESCAHGAHAGTASAPSRTTRSARRLELRTVGDEQDGPARRAAARRRRRRPRRSPGRGRRSARPGSTSGASRRNARASAIRRTWPAESGRPPSPTTRLVAVRAAQRTKPSAPAERGRLAHGRRPGGGVAQADVVRDRPAEERRPLRHPGDAAPARRPGRSRRGRRRRRSRARRSARPGAGAARRPCSSPLRSGPTSATVSPGSSSRSSPVEHRRRPRGVGEGDALEPHGRVARARRPRARRPRPLGSSARSSRRSPTARPSALAWYCAARFRSGR